MLSPALDGNHPLAKGYFAKLVGEKYHIIANFTVKWVAFNVLPDQSGNVLNNK
jgi:hypothetical protein